VITFTFTGKNMTNRKREPNAIQASAYTEVKRGIEDLQRSWEREEGEKRLNLKQNEIVEAFLVWALTRSDSEKRQMIAEAQEIIERVILPVDEPGRGLDSRDAIQPVPAVGVAQPGASAVIRKRKRNNPKGRRSAEQKIA
jgi:hypothetical protein